MLLMKKTCFDSIHSGTKRTTLGYWRPSRVRPVELADLTDDHARADGLGACNGHVDGCVLTGSGQKEGYTRSISHSSQLMSDLADFAAEEPSSRDALFLRDDLL